MPAISFIVTSNPKISWLDLMGTYTSLTSAWLSYFRDNTTHIHTPLVTGLDLIGTIHYTSINSHMGLQQKRRDDLESLGYTFLYLHYGKVPWQGILNRNPSCHRAAVLRQKQDLCKHSFEIVPSALMKFIQYAQSLGFEEDPDYIYCHSVLDGL